MGCRESIPENQSRSSSPQRSKNGFNMKHLSTRRNDLLWDAYFDEGDPRRTITDEDRYDPNAANDEAIISSKPLQSQENVPNSQRSTFVLCTTDSLLLIRSIQNIKFMSDLNGCENDDEIREIIKKLESKNDIKKREIDTLTDTTLPEDQDNQHEDNVKLAQDGSRMNEGTINSARSTSEINKSLSDTMEMIKTIHSNIRAKHKSMNLTSPRTPASLTPRSRPESTRFFSSDVDGIIEQSTAALNEDSTVSDTNEIKDKKSTDPIPPLAFPINSNAVSSKSTSARKAPPSGSTKAKTVNSARSNAAPTPRVVSYTMRCPGMRVPIRDQPNPKGGLLGYVKTGDIIHTYSKTIGGYFKLLDDKGYVNKATKGVEWLPTPPSTIGSDGQIVTSLVPVNEETTTSANVES